MFINTHAEAKLASRIARRYGYETLSDKRFHKRYVTSVLSPWSEERDAQDAIFEIASAIRTDRAMKRGVRSMTQ